MPNRRYQEAPKPQRSPNTEPRQEGRICLGEFKPRKSFSSDSDPVLPAKAMYESLPAAMFTSASSTSLAFNPKNLCTSRYRLSVQGETFNLTSHLQRDWWWMGIRWKLRLTESSKHGLHQSVYVFLTSHNLTIVEAWNWVRLCQWWSSRIDALFCWE